MSGRKPDRQGMNSSGGGVAVAHHDDVRLERRRVLGRQRGDGSDCPRRASVTRCRWHDLDALKAWIGDWAGRSDFASAGARKSKKNDGENRTGAAHSPWSSTIGAGP